VDVIVKNVLPAASPLHDEVRRRARNVANDRRRAPTLEGCMAIAGGVAQRS
jgi:hypothetical protein